MHTRVAPTTTAQHMALSDVLRQGEVHLWHVQLDQSGDQVRELARILAADEHQRAKQYGRAQQRFQYIIARGALRSILARYLHVDPTVITFQYTAHGKPSLANESQRDLHFNVAHSHTRALIAVARSEIGVDLEYMRVIADRDRLAAASCTPRERVLLQQCPVHEQQRLFFDIWTRKEAIVKACGYGLNVPLDQIETGVMLRSSTVVTKVGVWSLCSLAVEAGYAAAIAVQGPLHLVRSDMWDLGVGAEALPHHAVPHATTQV